MKKIWYAPYKFESYGEEEIKAVEESLRSGWLGGQGPKSVAVSYTHLTLPTIYSV